MHAVCLFSGHSTMAIAVIKLKLHGFYNASLAAKGGTWNQLIFCFFGFLCLAQKRKQVCRTVELYTGLKTLHFISGFHTKFFFFYNKMSGSSKLLNATNKIMHHLSSRLILISLWWLFQNWLLWHFSKQRINVLPQSFFSLLDNPMELNDSEMENFAQLSSWVLEELILLLLNWATILQIKKNKDVSQTW